jgi:hypothetical protein
MPLAVDPIGEAFDAIYAPWPLRFYIADTASRTLMFKAQPSDCSYDISQVERWLEKHCAADRMQ